MNQELDPLSEKDKLIEIKQIVYSVIEGLPNKFEKYGWSGEGLKIKQVNDEYTQYGGIVDPVANNDFRNKLTRLILFLQGYSDDKGNKFFAGVSVEEWKEIVKKLVLTRIYDIAITYHDNKNAFIGDMPKEWSNESEADVWKMARAITSHYPDGLNPFVNMLDRDFNFSGNIKAFEGINPDIIRPIEPSKLGIEFKHTLTKTTLSPRQALGLLVLWQREALEKKP